MTIEDKIRDMNLPDEDFHIEVHHMINLFMNLPMRILLCGETSIGKSKSQNSMHGKQIHEVGNLETTQCIVRTQDSDAIKIVYQGCEHHFQDVYSAQKFIQDLMRSMQKSNSSREIDFFFPIPSLRFDTRISRVLRSNTIFIDSMGIRNEKHTRAFDNLHDMSSNGVAVWLTGYSTLYDETKLASLANCLSNMYASFGKDTPLIVLVNKIDQHTSQDGALKKTFEYVENMLIQQNLSCTVLPFSAMIAEMGSILEVAYQSQNRDALLECLSRIKDLGLSQVRPILHYTNEKYDEEQESIARELLGLYYQQKKSEILLDEEIEALIDLLYNASGLQVYLNALNTIYASSMEKIRLSSIFDLLWNKKQELLINYSLQGMHVPDTWDEMFRIIEYLQARYGFAAPTRSGPMEYEVGDMWNGLLLLKLKQQGADYKMFQAVDPMSPAIRTEVILYAKPSLDRMRYVRENCEILSIPFQIRSDLMGLQYFPR